MLDTQRSSGTELGLRAGPFWSSFEKFRQEGARVLESVRSGVVGALQTKTGRYRVLVEEDFQKLYGMARDVKRLRNGITVIMVAAQAVQKHRDEATLETLLQAVAVMGHAPALPTRSGHEELEPEDLAGVDVDLDELEMDPVALHAAIEQGGE